VNRPTTVAPCASFVNRKFHHVLDYSPQQLLDFGAEFMGATYYATRMDTAQVSGPSSAIGNQTALLPSTTARGALPMCCHALPPISRSTNFRNAAFTMIRRTALAAACLAAVPAQALTVQWTTGAGATGHWYELVPDQDKGWTAAQVDAVGKGGNLVSIRSAEEQAFLIDNLFKQCDDPDAAFGSYWIGLTDAGNEQGTSTAGWTWSSGEGYAFNFFATASGQPDNNASAPFGDGSAGEDRIPAGRQLVRPPPRLGVRVEHPKPCRSDLQIAIERRSDLQIAICGRRNRDLEIAPTIDGPIAMGQSANGRLPAVSAFLTPPRRGPVLCCGYFTVG
jgi:hypothetical protein